MRNEYLIKAVTGDTRNVLGPVLNAAYQLEPMGKYEIVEIAAKVNEQLGYDLFEELYYPRLVKDFALVARAVQTNALRGNLNEFSE